MYVIFLIFHVDRMNGVLELNMRKEIAGRRTGRSIVTDASRTNRSPPTSIILINCAGNEDKLIRSPKIFCKVGVASEQFVSNLLHN